MGIYLNPGNSGFEEIRKGKYVDKTGLINLMNERIQTPEKLVCVSRPRRFGKSFAAKMLCAYYDSSCDSHKLFDDLEIAKSGDYDTHINKYNVICLDIAGFISMVTSAGQPINNVVNEITNCIKKELKETYSSVVRTDRLLECMKKCVELTGKKFIFIIDEWDAIIREAKNQSNIQNQYLNLIRSWFKNFNYTSDIVAAAYMTGILPIKKDGFESAISEFKEFTMLKPRKFGAYVGFNEEEVKDLCEESNSSFDKMKQWYDGYFIKGVGSVYNPNSVMEAIRNEEFDSYWRKTSAAESLLTYIDMDVDGLQMDIISLINGKLIEVNTRSFENDFQSFSDKNDVLTLMIHLGYLAYEEIENGIGFVKIPNEEIRKEFQDMFRHGKHPELIKMIQISDKLLKDTIQGNEEEVVEAIESIRDMNYAATFYNNEQALRYVIKMAYITCVDQYLKIEELQSGHGIADVVFIPKRYSSLPAMVVELKWNKTVEGAINQIKKKNYPAILRNYGGEIILVGINYNEKTKEHICRIEKM